MLALALARRSTRTALGIATEQRRIPAASTRHAQRAPPASASASASFSSLAAAAAAPPSPSSRSYEYNNNNRQKRRKRPKTLAPEQHFDAIEQARHALLEHAHALLSNTAAPAQQHPADIDIDTHVALLVHLARLKPPHTDAERYPQHQNTCIALVQHALGILSSSSHPAWDPLGTLLAAATRAVHSQQALHSIVLQFIHQIQPALDPSPSAAPSSTPSEHFFARRILPAIINSFGKAGALHVAEKLIGHGPPSASASATDKVSITTVLHAIVRNAPQRRKQPPPYSPAQLAAFHAYAALGLADERRKRIQKHADTKKSRPNHAASRPAAPDPHPTVTFPDITSFHLGAWSAQPAVWASLITARIRAADEAGAEIWLHIYRALMLHRRWLAISPAPPDQQQADHSPQGPGPRPAVPNSSAGHPTSTSKSQHEGGGSSSSSSSSELNPLLDARARTALLPPPSALPYHARVYATGDRPSASFRGSRMRQWKDRPLAHVVHKVRAALQADPALVAPYQTEIIRETLIRMHQDRIRPDPPLWAFLIGFEAGCRRVVSAAELVEAMLAQTVRELVRGGRRGGGQEAKTNGSQEEEEEAADEKEKKQQGGDALLPEITPLDLARRLGPRLLGSLAEIHIQRARLRAELERERLEALNELFLHARNEKDDPSGESSSSSSSSSKVVAMWEASEDGKAWRRRWDTLEHGVLDRAKHPLAVAVCGRTPEDMLALWLRVYGWELPSSSSSSMGTVSDVDGERGAAPLGDPGRHDPDEEHDDAELGRDANDDEDDADADADADHYRDPGDADGVDSQPDLRTLYKRPPLQAAAWLERYLTSLLAPPSYAYPHALLLLEALEHQARRLRDREGEGEGEGGSGSGSGGSGGSGGGAAPSRVGIDQVNLHALSMSLTADVVPELLRAGHDHVMRHYADAGAATGSGSGSGSGRSRAAAAVVTGGPEDGAGDAQPELTIEHTEEDGGLKTGVTLTLERRVAPSPPPARRRPSNVRGGDAVKGSQKDHRSTHEENEVSRADAEEEEEEEGAAATPAPPLLRTMLESATASELKLSASLYLDAVANASAANRRRSGALDEALLRDGPAFRAALARAGAEGSGEDTGDEEPSHPRAAWARELLLNGADDGCGEHRASEEQASAEEEEEEEEKQSGEARVRANRLLMREGFIENAYDRRSGFAGPPPPPAGQPKEDAVAAGGSDSGAGEDPAGTAPDPDWDPPGRRALVELALARTRAALERRGRELARGLGADLVRRALVEPGSPDAASASSASASAQAGAEERTPDGADAGEKARTVRNIVYQPGPRRKQDLV